MKPAKKLFTESPYNFPDQQDYENFVGMSQKPRFPSAISRETFPSQFAIGDKVKFRIGPTAEVDAVIYAARFEAATVWYDLIFDPYVGTPEQGGYTILTNVRSLMIHPSEFQERVKRITFKEAKEIKMKVHKKFFVEASPVIEQFTKEIVEGLVDNNYIERAAQGEARKVVKFYLEHEGLTTSEMANITSDASGIHFQNILAEIEKAGLAPSEDEEESSSSLNPDMEKGLEYIRRGLRQSNIRNLQDKERLEHSISDLLRTCDQNGSFTAINERKFQMFLSNM